MFNKDISNPLFNIDRLIKCPEARNKIYKELLKNFEQILIFFTELMVLSDDWPKIDFSTIDLALEDIQLKNGGKMELPKSVIGLQF